MCRSYERVGRQGCSGGASAVWAGLALRAYRTRLCAGEWLRWGLGEICTRPEGPHL